MLGNDDPGTFLHPKSLMQTSNDHSFAIPISGTSFLGIGIRRQALPPLPL
jgi:hypothetical protein